MTSKKELRDRTQELLRVPAAQIDGAAWNWRTHSKQQQAALAGALEEIGFISPLLVRRIGERYELIDGHLRQDLISRQIGPETLIPCVALDLDEADAKLANLTLDPLAALAEADSEKLDALLREVQTGDEDLAKMLDELARKHGLVPGEEGEEKPGVESGESRFDVLVECGSEEAQAKLLERLTAEGYTCRSLIC